MGDCAFKFVSSNQHPWGALPRLFRKPRVLIVGCGDVGTRCLPLLRHARVTVLSSTPERVTELRQQGVRALLGNLDAPDSLRRLSGLASRVLQLAPPAARTDGISRDAALARALLKRPSLQRMVYASTSGVYGDCQGAWVNETRQPKPQTERAIRRWAAEQTWRQFSRIMGTSLCVLRVPGIYALDREGGTPIERLRKGTPALLAEDDVFTNHIHANDLARACLRALWRPRLQALINVCDESAMKMGIYFDLCAELFNLPRPPRLPKVELERLLPPMAMSFMRESRRLDNSRMKKQLGLLLHYPHVLDGLKVRSEENSGGSNHGP